VNIETPFVEVIGADVKLEKKIMIEDEIDSGSSAIQPLIGQWVPKGCIRVVYISAFGV
jgi:hypothetical protein